MKPPKEPKERTKPGPKVDPDELTRVLIDAERTSDPEAARDHGISLRTLYNYRARMRADPIVAERFTKRLAEVDLGWKADRVSALRAAHRRAKTLIATEKDLDKITRFIEKTGGVDITSEALGVGSDSSAPEGRRPPPNPSSDGGEAAESGPLPH